MNQLKTPEPVCPTVEAAGDLTSFKLSYPWLVDLEITLNNVEGNKAFESYLARCGSLALLEFIWACDGMKSLVDENPEKADQLVSCIYKNYIISGSLPILSNHVVLQIAKCLEAHFERPEPSYTFQGGGCEPQRMKEPEQRKLDLSVFDVARKEVEDYLGNNVFPQFQKAVESGNVCVGESEDGVVKGAIGKNPSPFCSKNARSKLASHPEAFARALCEKLEGLQLKRGKEDET